MQADQFPVFAYVQLRQLIKRALQLLQCRKVPNPRQVTDFFTAAIYRFYRRNFLRTERVVTIVVNFSIVKAVYTIEIGISR